MPPLNTFLPPIRPSLRLNAQPLHSEPSPAPSSSPLFPTRMGFSRAQTTPKSQLFGGFPLFLEIAVPLSWAAVTELPLAPLASWRENKHPGKTPTPFAPLSQRREDPKDVGKNRAPDALQTASPRRGGVCLCKPTHSNVAAPVNRGAAVFRSHARDGCGVSGWHYFAPSGLPGLRRFAVPGRCPGLFYCALSGRKEESPVTWRHALGLAREQSWAKCPCHKTSRRFSCSAACIRKEIGESKAKHPAATEIRPHPYERASCVKAQNAL